MECSTREGPKTLRIGVCVIVCYLISLDVLNGSLTSKGVNFEVQALMAIKDLLVDPHGELDNWDANAVDPCSWATVTCSSDNLVVGLGAPSNNLSGTLSSSIGNLTNLQTVLLLNNNIAGALPAEIGKLRKLRTLDLSNNMFSGSVPSSFGSLSGLQYLRLNNNSLSGSFPSSLTNLSQLVFLDLSFNNVTGPVPSLTIKTFKQVNSLSPSHSCLGHTFRSIVGNPMICATGAEPDCSKSTLFPKSARVNSLRSTSSKNPRLPVVFGSTISLFTFLILLLGLFLWRRHRRGDSLQHYRKGSTLYHQKEFRLGNVRRFQFKHLQTATNNFSGKNEVGRGGFGVVYRGVLQDKAVVAVKRLKDTTAVAGEAQFQTEVEMISLAVHRNLLKLTGYCTTPTERLLVYPYMVNGSVASRLKAKPPLDWPTRKRVALGAARGLLYLHEQCDPKIIHRDVKAANILLDEYCEAVVGDFGLAKFLDHQDSHVTTAVRGTVGHIAPEYLSTGQSSEKTDVFGFGILLVELISGQKAVECGKGAMLDWVRKMHGEGKVEALVDREMSGGFDRVEVEEAVRVALLCTQFLPGHRPKMAEVVRMLEGDGVAEKWEASQKEETTGKIKGLGSSSSDRFSDLTDDSSLLAQAMELSGPR